jgi:cell shape-determining protein MreD
MKHLLKFLLLYPLFLAQASLAPWSPDFLLLTVVTLAVVGDRSISPGANRLIAYGLGATAGLLLDQLAPGAFGLNLLVYSIVGYGTAAMAGVTYRPPWIALPVIVVAIGLRVCAGRLTAAGMPEIGPLATSTALTLILTLPWHLAARRLFRLP